MAESYTGDAYCVKCKEKRDFTGEVKVSESGRHNAHAHPRNGRPPAPPPGGGRAGPRGGRPLSPSPAVPRGRADLRWPA